MKKRKTILILIFSLVILTCGSLYLYKKNNKPAHTVSDAKTTSTAPTAQADFNDAKPSNDKSDPGNTIREDRGSAVVEEDSKTNITPKSQWTISKTGQITLYSPASGQKASTGTKISGESTLGQVYFRIIDDTSGMLSTGKLNVTNGHFSGTINIGTSATKGRIDVFGMSNKGAEYSEINIPVRFN